METYRVENDGRLLAFVDNVENVLDQIAHELEVAHRPRGYADRRDELRHRTAERLFCGWVDGRGSSVNGDRVKKALANMAAVWAWEMAGVLADLDPESPDRLRGKAEVDAALDTPSADRPPTA